MKKQTGLRLLITLGSVLALGAGPAAHAAGLPTTPQDTSPANAPGIPSGGSLGGASLSGNSPFGSGDGSPPEGKSGQGGSPHEGKSGQGGSPPGGDGGNHGFDHDRDDLPPNELPEFPVAAVAPVVVLGSAAIYVFNQRRRKHETS